MSTETTRRDLVARDDDRHDHAGEAGWVERMSIAFADPAQTWGGIATVEIVPGEDRGTSSLVIFLPGGGVAMSLARAKVTGRAGMVVGPLEFYADEAMARWTVHCKDLALVFPRAEDTVIGTTERSGAAAQILADLTFVAAGDPRGTAIRRTESTEGFVRAFSAGTFLQTGTVTGSIRVGKNVLAIECAGMRARAWGVRDAARARFEFLSSGLGSVTEALGDELVEATTAESPGDTEALAFIDAGGACISLLRGADGCGVSCVGSG